MPAPTDNALHRNTPSVAVLDNRGLVARTIDYHRHPDSLALTEARITRQQHDARGFMRHSSDPRLHAAGRLNFTWLTDLAGRPLCTQSADAGLSINLDDAAGRPLLAVARIALDEAGRHDRSEAVTRTWHYESADLPGRLLGISEQVNGLAACRLERLTYGANGEAQKAYNLAGQPCLHYDTAGLLSTHGYSLTGEPIATTQRLLAAAQDPQASPDWGGEQPAHWEAQLQLQSQACSTTSWVDATGALLTQRDAAGHLRRHAYDVAGLLQRSWLTLAGGREQVIIEALRYSAAGQKLQESHGNGLVTHYQYEPRTHRLAAVRTQRPAGHARGAKVLQDLRYAYDPVGNVLSVRDAAEPVRYWRNQRVEAHSSYAYDSLYQLVGASGREMANAGQRGLKLPALATLDHVTYTRYSRAYTYDRAGNLTRMRHSSPASNHNYTTELTVSDRSNRAVHSSLTRTASDVEALFNASGEQKTLMPGQQLAWTPRGELHAVTPVSRDAEADDCESYRYDMGNQRVLKVSTRKTAAGLRTQRVQYLPGLELRSTLQGDRLTQALQVLDLGGEGHAQVRALHWATGKPPELANAQLRYSYTDQLGSGCLEVDGSGAVITQEAYYPYGGTAVWAAASEVQGRYKFVRYSGKEQDATGLYYYGYRYYQPWLGRWLSADPAGTVDGLNLFAMVGNNPVTRVDEQGLMLRSVANLFGFGGAAAAAQSESESESEASAPPSPSPSSSPSDPGPSAGPAADAEPSPPGAGAQVHSNDLAEQHRLKLAKRRKDKKEKAKAKKEADTLAAAAAAEREKKKLQTRAAPAAPVGIFGTLTHNRDIYDRLQPRLPTASRTKGDSILAIGQRPIENTRKTEVVFVEKGVSKEGFKHITEEHRADFKQVGIDTDKKILDLVMSAVVSGTVVGIQGKTDRQVGRPIYEVTFDGKLRHVAAQLKEDNSIFAANPKRYVSKQERDALKPQPLRRF
ncbi:RHS repeat-associated core domain-containing protein [Pseudomonas sp. NPDC087029]|uniref:RHS repeat-associated core domain-containing protein n=1 Tax=Pseudomonas sp. NPDC087029 TaxID=3364433 RepID=UPI00382BA47C